MAAEDRVGTVLDGRYQVDALIGVGGMAAVYAATAPSGERVALKVLHAAASSNAEVRARFLRESYVANKIDHPDVVRVHDHVLAEDGSVFLVMDLLEGKTLEADRVDRGGSLPPARATRLVIEVLDVLAAAHAKRIVHRDIKPDNVFLTTDGRTKLMDFGIARVLDAVRMTASAALMGTPAFMSPEQAGSRNKEITPASDVWSVAAVLFVLLTGQEVHPSMSGPEQIVFAAMKPARKIETVLPSLPPPLCDVVNVGLAYEARSRFQSAAAMATALRHVVETCGLRDEAPAAPAARLPLRGEGPIVAGATTMVHGSGTDALPKRGPER